MIPLSRQVGACHAEAIQVPGGADGQPGSEALGTGCRPGFQWVSHMGVLSRQGPKG